MSDADYCEKINLANEQIILVMSNPTANRDALRTGVRGVTAIVDELESVEPANSELATAARSYTRSLRVLMAGMNSAIDGKRTASSLQPDVVDFQIAAAGLLPFCELR